MTAETYIESTHSHQDGHPSQYPFRDGSVSPIISVCSGFTDISYTATSDPSLAYTPCDPLLLTPISSAGSPPMPQSSKLLSHYSASTAAAAAQQPTPPTSSKMYWTAPFDINAPTSQSGSPMPAGHPSTSMASDGHFEMAYLPRDENPEPPKSPYFGQFSVSEPLNQEQEEHVQTYYGIACVEDHPLLIRPQQAPEVSSPQPQYQQIDVHGPIIPEKPVGSTLDQPEYPNLSKLDDEDSRLASFLAPRHGTSKGLRDGKSRVVKRKTKIIRQRVRSTEERAKKDTATYSVPEARSEPIQFKVCVPDEERYLVQLRMQYSDTKGKTMWDDIGREFAKRFGKKPEKAALQMKLTRAKQKWIQWSERDQKLLTEVFLEDEKERYQRITAKFHERGGGSNIGFNAGNIECQLVEMGLEDLFMHPNMVRPRKRPSERRRSSAKGEPETQEPVVPTPYRDNPAGFSMTDAQRETLYEQIESRDNGTHTIKGEPEEEMAADLRYYHQQHLQQQQQQQQQQHHHHHGA